MILGAMRSSKFISSLSAAPLAGQVADRLGQDGDGAGLGFNQQPDERSWNSLP
jgi:hypothetical protein